MLWQAQNYARSLYRSVAQHIPAERNRMKHVAELNHWRQELVNLHAWFITGAKDWWGLPPACRDAREAGSDHWATNAIMTMHKVRPTYHEELQLERNAFAGERVLEIGCGPLAPILQFDDCERHGVDPLLDQYIETGWPIYDLSAKLINAHGERLPYPDGWFDSVISVNALDHVDDFDQVAAEMARVLRPGGRVRFEVEYHDHPSVTEPIVLDDEKVRSAFRELRMTKLRHLTAQQLFGNLSQRYGLRGDLALGNNEQYVLWSGEKA